MSPSHQVHWTLTKMCPEQWPFHGHHLQMRSVMTGSTTWWPNGTRSKEHGTPLEIAFSTTGSLSATSCQVVNTSSGSMPRTTWAAPNQWNHQNGWLLPKKVGTEDEGRILPSANYFFKNVIVPKLQFRFMSYSSVWRIQRPYPKWHMGN